MAEVYEAIAYDSVHGIEKPLVIKRILEQHGQDPNFREMFIDEARVAMRLNHPNVVQVFEFGKADDRYFLAMELVRGKDLGALLSRAKTQDRTVPAGVALFIAGEVAKGLDHAHRLTGPDGKAIGLVHRDVSPQNILLSVDGSVKIGDFGIAKFNTRKEMTQAETVRGKVRYMSPEQAEGKTLDPRSDLFSLGLVLYEMITGAAAFDGRSDIDVLEAVRAGIPRKPSSIISVPAEIEEIVLRALAKDPKKRYPRGNDLQRDLETVSSKMGLRASSGALAEFLLSLFPELEQRTSDAGGETQIRKIQPPPALASRGETTRIRRVADADGLPMFVSEEIRMPAEPSRTESGSAPESSVTRNPEPSITVNPDFQTRGPIVGAVIPQNRERSVETVMSPPPPPPDRPERRTRGSAVPVAFHAEETAASAIRRIDPLPTPAQRAAKPPTDPSIADPDPQPPPPRPAPAKPRTSTAPLTTAVIAIVIAAGFFLARWTPLGRSFTGAGEDEPGPTEEVIDPKAIGFLALLGAGRAFALLDAF